MKNFLIPLVSAPLFLLAPSVADSISIAPDMHAVVKEEADVVLPYDPGVEKDMTISPTGLPDEGATVQCSQPVVIGVRDDGMQVNHILMCDQDANVVGVTVFSGEP